MLGLVGAGGIGMALDAALNLFQWDRVALILLAIVGRRDRRRGRRHAGAQARDLKRPRLAYPRRHDDHRGLQPEGRRRQDDDGAQPARGDRAPQAAAARHRPRSAGAPVARLRRAPASSPTIPSTVSSCASGRSPTSRRSPKSGVVLCPAHLELAKLDSLLGQGRQRRHPAAPGAARARRRAGPGRHRLLPAAQRAVAQRGLRLRPAAGAGVVRLPLAAGRRARWSAR